MSLALITSLGGGVPRMQKLKIQTLKLGRTLFIRTKDNMRIFGVIPFKQQLNGENDEKLDGELIRLSFWE